MNSGRGPLGHTGRVSMDQKDGGRTRVGGVQIVGQYPSVDSKSKLGRKVHRYKRTK